MKQSIPLAVLFAFNLSMQAQSAIELLDKLIGENQKISRVAMTIIMNERVNGNMNEQKAFFKINYDPVKIYLKQEYPNEGMEILYIHNQNDNKALINPNSFPWITLSLDPNGNAMRKGHHHSIFNSGFDHFVKIVEHLKTKYQREISDLVKYAGIEFINEVKCQKIVFENPYFKFIKYRVKPDEDLVSIAKKFYINEYMILENNPGIANYGDVKIGQVIRIPNDYAQKVSIYLDAGTFLPYHLQVFDDRGLFQEYFFLGIEVNPYFVSADFDAHNPKYNF